LAHEPAAVDVGAPGLGGEGLGAKERTDAGGPGGLEGAVFLGQNKAGGFGSAQEDGGLTQQAGFEDIAMAIVALAGKLGIAEEIQGFTQDR